MAVTPDDEHMETRSINRRRLLRRGAGSLLAGATLPALAMSAMANGARFPSRPITLVVPWPAGGATDMTMRVLGDLVARQLGQQVVIENRPGAAGTMAMPILQQAAPDGYTIAQLPITIYRAPYVQKVLWDPIRDVTPIIRVSGVTFGVLVPVNSPFKSFDDILQFAQKNPGVLTVGTNGVGTTPHVAMDELFGKLGATWNHVPYKGTTEQMLAVVTGQLMVGINSNGFAPFVEQGKLRLLALFSAQRSKRWAEVPTLRELGHDIVANSPYGLGGPRGLPREIVMTLHDAFRTAMSDPVHLAALTQYDQELAYQGPDEYARYAQATFARERNVVERLGLKSGG